MTPEIILVLTLVMPQQLPDKNYRLPMDSIEECATEVKEFVSRGVTEVMLKQGVVAVMGSCMTTKKFEDNAL